MWKLIAGVVGLFAGAAVEHYILPFGAYTVLPVIAGFLSYGHKLDRSFIGQKKELSKGGKALKQAVVKAARNRNLA